MSRRSGQNEMDLTMGSFFRKIPLFSIPLAVTTILQLLYTTIDLATVNLFGGGPLSMTAVGSNGALINLIVVLFNAISIGANVTMSSYKGANDKDNCQKTLHTGLIIALVSGLFVGCIGFFFAPQLLMIMGTPTLILDKATQYLKIYFIGMPFMMIYNFAAQMLRALGDSKRPLYILFFSGLANIIFDFICVYFIDLDVIGVALATVVSMVVSCLLVMIYLIKTKLCFVNFRIKEFKCDKKILGEILKIGLPAGVQGLAFSIPNVLIQSSLYSIEPYTINGTLINQAEIISGAAGSAQVEGYAFAIIDSFGTGLISFIGQNIGAKKKENIMKCYGSAIAWMGISVAFCLTIILTLGSPLLSIFISDDPTEGVVAFNAILAAKERLFIMMVPYVLNGFMNINGSYMKGIKRSVIPALLTLFGCTGLRIVFLTTIFKLEQFHTIFWLYAAFPISWVLVDLVYVPILILSTKKVYKQMDLELVQGAC